MRVAQNKRRISTGILRPNIVLYGEAHPSGDAIGAIQSKDLRRRPDLLLVFGTSLKIPGVKALITDFRAAAPQCLLVFVNATPPPSFFNDKFVFITGGH